jgi:membrane protein
MKFTKPEIKRFFDKFINDETTTLSASLAFYTALSMAPLVIIFVALTTQIGPSLQKTFLDEARIMIGDEGAASIRMVIDAANARADLSSLAGWIGAGVLLFSASLVFGELRFALNKIFRRQPAAPESPQTLFEVIRSLIKERLFHIGLALGFLVALLLSVFVASYRTDYKTLNFFVSWVFSVLFFASIFRFMPRPRAPWLQSYFGGTVTATFFLIGKELIALYLRESAIGSAYGAAGSVIVLMVWIYYSSLITLIGAQLSAVLITPLRRELGEIEATGKI